MGWLTGWSKRKPITLTGGSDGAQTDFQLKLSIAYDSDMQSDFDDLRFTKEDGTTLIDAWLEDKTDGTSADVVVEFPSTPASGETQTYYMYYGKSDALDDWDIGATFLFADDFEYADDAALQSAWNTTDTNFKLDTSIYISGDKSELEDTNFSGNAYRNDLPDGDKIIEWWARHDTDGDVDQPSLREADGSLLFYLNSGYPTSGKWGYVITGGSWTASSVDSTKDVWQKMKIVVYDSNSKFSAYVDGAVIFTDESLSPVDSKRIEYYKGSESGSKIWHDGLRVRKYTANPPTYEFGSEQSESGGLSMAVVMHHLKQQRIS